MNEGEEINHITKFLARCTDMLWSEVEDNFINCVNCHVATKMGGEKKCSNYGGIESFT